MIEEYQETGDSIIDLPSFSVYNDAAVEMVGIVNNYNQLMKNYRNYVKTLTEIQ